jgi:hypothetical protein
MSREKLFWITKNILFTLPIQNALSLRHLVCEYRMSNEMYTHNCFWIF